MSAAAALVPAKGGANAGTEAKARLADCRATVAAFGCAASPEKRGGGSDSGRPP